MNQPNFARFEGDRKIKKLIFSENIIEWTGPPSHWSLNDSEDPNLKRASLLIVSHVLRLESSTNANYVTPMDEGAKFVVSCKQYFNAHDNGISVTGMGALARYVRLDTDCSRWENYDELVEQMKKTDVPEAVDQKGLPVKINKERIITTEQDKKIFKELVASPLFDITIKYDIEGRRRAFIIDEQSTDYDIYEDNLKIEREEKKYLNANTNNTGS